jgi:hypothetical protein
MKFSAPSPERYRISDCGRYLVEKISCAGKPVYCLWEYVTQRGGFDSMEDCKNAAMTKEFHRFEAAAQVGTVNRCPTCGQEDGAIGIVREALEGDIGL